MQTEDRAQRLPLRYSMGSITRWTAAIVLITVFFLFPGCTRKPEQIKIGVILPLTGLHSSFGDAMKKGYELALGEVNAELKGKQFVLVMEDDQSDEQKAIQAALKLINEEKAVALMGSYSSASTSSAIEIANYNMIPMVIPASAADPITQKGFKWIFRINPPSSIYAKATLQYISSLPGVASVGILHENSIFGTTNAKYLLKYAKEGNLDVRFCSGYDQRSTSFIPVLLSQMKKKKPDILIMIAYLEDAVTIINGCRTMGIQPKAFIGIGAGFSIPEFITRAGDSANYIFNVNEWSAYSRAPKTCDFVKRFEDVYHEKPTFHSIEAYVATKVLTQAILQAQSTKRDAIRESLSRIEVSTPYSKIKFEAFDGYTNQNRFSIENMVVLQIQKNKFVVVWPDDLKGADAIFPARY